MTNEKTLQYKKAYVELYEIIKNLSEQEKAKISNEFINNLIENKDKNYTFHLDNMPINEQNLMVETKALLVQLYIKYLAPESERELWEKYNQICLNKIEEKRREKYNPDNIFKKHKESQETQQEITKSNNSMIQYKESILKKIINKIKKAIRDIS